MFFSLRFLIYFFLSFVKMHIKNFSLIWLSHIGFRMNACLSCRHSNLDVILQAGQFPKHNQSVRQGVAMIVPWQSGGRMS